MSAIYESWNPITQRHTEVIIDDDSGLPVIIHSQNTRPIVEQNKREAAAFDPIAPRTKDAGWTKVASIPLVIYRDLQRKGITQDPRLLAAWLNDSETRFFRTDDGRQL